MSITENKNDIARRGRMNMDAGGPAGGLYANGAFSVADMVGRNATGSGRCGTICTGSGVAQCC